MIFVACFKHLRRHILRPTVSRNQSIFLLLNMKKEKNNKQSIGEIFNKYTKKNLEKNKQQ
jgi:hypothetical protein